MSMEQKELSQIQLLKVRAKELKKNIGVLYIAFKHKDTPWYAKVLIAAIISYALSPIDLIPDFVPILGYLDDLILIPAGITLAIKLIPAEVMVECRTKAEELPSLKKKGIYGAILIVIIWCLIVYSVFRILI